MRVLTAGSVLALATGDVSRHVASARRGTVRLSGLSGSVRTLMLAAASLEAGRAVVVVADEREAESLRDDLAAVLQELAGAAGVSAPALLFFPPLEADPYQGIGAHPQVLAERAGTLSRMRREPRWVVVAPYAALLAPLLPVDRFEALFLELVPGKAMPFEDLAARLAGAGFSRVDMASAAGEWARRGGIFDVFPPGLSDPVRIELEDDVVASLRLFDPLTQRSLETREQVEIPPAREAPLGPGERAELIRKLERTPRTGGRLLGVDPLEALVVEETFAGVEACAGLWAGRETDLMEYAGEALLVLDEPFRIEADSGAVIGELAAAHEATGAPLPPPRRLLLPEDRLGERLAGPRLELHDLSVAEPEADEREAALRVELSGRTPRAYFGRLADLGADLSKAVESGHHSLLLLETEGLLERTREVLEERGLNPAVLPASIPAGGEIPLLSLARGRLAHGFELPEQGLTVLTERDVYGERRGQRPRGGRRAAPFRSDFRDLAVGDMVVHVDHGIGRYQGIRRLGADGSGGEFMVLVYRGDNVLYVPVDRLDLVQKYSGVGGKAPRLDRLGAPAWDKVRKRAKKQVQDLADQLLELYASRRALPGRAMAADTPWQREFEAAFPFEETPDQIQAIQDVKEGMEATEPMDRLLCGDVGFGKTEVAMRAAFKAVMGGTQVAVLAPTTVLAFQHFNTFRDRFAPFPVTIEMLSRFQSRPRQNEIVRKVKEGAVDVVIGTHRLLSKDVAFPDLGLLVVDEEQRFGVAHKERLKQLSRRVDVLTLTATPLPRTLQMSLAGVRDLSVIETPPENRLAIQTMLLPFRTGIVGQAIRRELRRGGQIFFVHNRVESIPSMAAAIRQAVPEVTLEVAHGRLDEKRLEDVMLRYMAGEFQLLLTTTIIENGLDIPRANTIIINRADRFGLAQLYQLRGRVGRSDVRAHAYLLIPPQRKLTEVARRRLKALQEFTELGAGFRVAARDLEIRGAGDLLGSRQHGHIAALGFDLYCSMLEEAVREKRGEAPAAPDVRVVMELGVDYRLPESYVPEAHQRLVLYKRIVAAAEDGELERVREEIEDRFGHLPEEAANLLELAGIRTMAERLGIAHLDLKGGFLRLHFVDGAPIDPGRLLEWVRSGTAATLSPGGILAIPAAPEADRLLEQTRDLLETLLERTTPAGGEAGGSPLQPYGSS
jgi:transcription-repair coupling factor (superfamily II helicase)